MYSYDSADFADELLDDLDDIDEFKSTFRIKTRLASSRHFAVTSGTVTVTASTRWNLPCVCPIRSYIVRLWRNVDWWFDEDKGARTFSIPGPSTATWSGLSSGDYYLEIDVGSTNTTCVLSGDIEVTT